LAGQFVDQLPGCGPFRGKTRRKQVCAVADRPIARLVSLLSALTR
jgi:hypothetical protein